MITFYDFALLIEISLVKEYLTQSWKLEKPLMLLFVFAFYIHYWIKKIRKHVV